MEQPVLVIGGISFDTNIHVYNLPLGNNGDVSYVTHRIFDHIGGSAMNVAFALKKMGIKTKIVSVLGKDFPGRYIKQQLSDMGFDSSNLILSWKSNSRSVNLVAPDRKRYILLDAKDAMEFIMPPENYLHLLTPGRIAHFCVVNWTRPIIKEAKKRGMITCTDLHTGFDINGYHKDFAENATILFFSSEGLADWKEVGYKLLSMGPEKVICMMGYEGCSIFDKNGFCHYPPSSFTDNIIDPMGAGDAMVGGYLASLFKDLDKEEQIERAQISGLYACTNKGTQDCYIDPESLEEIVFRR